MNRRETGRLGERLAADFLSARGYEILARNYRCPRGEIDIVARHEGCLSFVEVRTKRGLAFGTPEESITRSKMSKLRLAAQHYLEEHASQDAPWRIDVLAIEIDGGGRVARIELYENAMGE